MSCQWYNPELPNSVYYNNSNNGQSSSCNSCNGTQYNVNVMNGTKANLNMVYVSGIPIDIIGDLQGEYDVPPPLAPGEVGHIVSNKCNLDGSGCPLNQFTTKPTSPMTLTFTDASNGNPVPIIIQLPSSCKGKSSQRVNNITYTVTWTLNGSITLTNNAPLLALTVTRNPTDNVVVVV
jgi:hypothetical protein